MADDVLDGKRTEVVCTKLSERMALDLLRMASRDERSISDYLFRLIVRDLYGRLRDQSGNGEAATYTK